MKKMVLVSVARFHISNYTGLNSVVARQMKLYNATNVSIIRSVVLFLGDSSLLY